MNTMRDRWKSVYSTLRELEIGDKKVLTAFNKIDRMEAGDQRTVYKDPRSDKTVYISAREKSGLKMNCWKKQKKY